MRLFRKVGIQTPVAVNQKNGKGYPFPVCYHFIFLQRIKLRIFAIIFSIRKRPAKQKMIAKIVKGDQLAKNICYHFCVGQLAGAIQNDSILA
ncbi:hypothetical protein GIS89_21600 [Salmonella enterica]|nr:hypothetical protein [Salmonella enterica]EJE5650316.1 hypothetical protein [Salmonella enterica]ELF2409157.1 hypothetical protein [Salmonella enterica]HDY3216906.1 hypothetical protein [Salmonella enterica]HDY3731073.1 hypothetical protein [Salmonella enterica]